MPNFWQNTHFWRSFPSAEWNVCRIAEYNASILKNKKWVIDINKEYFGRHFGKSNYVILKLFHVRKLGNPSHSLSVYSIISYEQTRLPRDTYIKAHSRNVCIFTNVYFLIILCKNKQIKWSFCVFFKRKLCIFVNIWNLEIYSSNSNF